MNFDFYNPTKIHFGPNVVEKIGTEARIWGTKALLIVYEGKDGTVLQNVYQAVVKSLDAAGITYEELSGIQANPSITKVDEGAAICREKGIDVAIAIGGGSVIDTAKGVCAATYYDGPAWDLLKKNVPIEKALPLLVVSTMAASGSEMDGSAVISNEETNEKLVLNNPWLLPKISYLDPTYTYSAPKGQTAAGAADIFIHSMESYFDSANDIYLTDNFAESIMRTCVKYAPIVLQEPDNAEARANLMWAAPWAMNGLLNCGRHEGWTLHSLQHALGGFYHITHGAALAVLTPHWFRQILSEKTIDKFIAFGTNVFGIDANLSSWDIAEAAIAAVEKFFFEDLQIPRTLREMGVDETHLRESAIIAAKNTARFYVPLTAEEIENIYRAALKENV